MDEGYVKFRAAVNADRPTSLSSCVPRLKELNGARSRLYSLGLIGMNDRGIGFGNISMRAEVAGVPPGNAVADGRLQPGGPGPDAAVAFVVSGSATGGKPRLEPDDYCEILSFDPGKNEVTYNGRIPPSSETMSHGAVYLSAPLVRFVIHVHHAKLFDYMMAGGYPRTPADADFGTPRLALEIAGLVRRLGRQEGLLVLAGHRDGILSYGRDLETAMSLLLDAYETAGSAHP